MSIRSPATLAALVGATPSRSALGGARLASVKPARRAASTSAAPAATPSDPIEYCRSRLQLQDHPAYLSSFFYPAGRERDAFLAFRAFNIELASIPETTSNHMIGRMRTTFWRDVIRDISNGAPPPKHPVALALAMTMAADPRSIDLTAYYLNQIIDEREATTHDPTHPTLVHLLTHLTQTSTPLHLLSLSLLTPTPSETATTSLQHLSLSSGLSTLLRSLPALAQRRGLPALPADVLASHGCAAEDIFRNGGEAKGVKEAVWEVAVRANDELETARAEWKGERIPKEIMPAFLSSVASSNYLEKLRLANSDAFHPSLQQKNWRLPLDTWLASRRRKI